MFNSTEINWFLELSDFLKEPREVSSANISMLFHYTRNETKNKIVGENEISFLLSRADSFLDKNEGIQVLEPYYHACGDLFEKSEVSERFYKFLMRINVEELKRTSKFWVFCFSKNANSVFLKRRYAANNGWILGTAFYTLENLCDAFPEELGELRLYEVEYSFDKIFEQIKETLRECYEKYVAVTQGMTEKYLLYQEKILKKHIANWLSEYGLICKGHDYSGEEEIRLLCNFKRKTLKRENQEQGWRIEKKRKTVKLYFAKKRLVYATQELEPCFDTRLNKPIVKVNEIREVLKGK